MRKYLPAIAIAAGVVLIAVAVILWRGGPEPGVPGETGPATAAEGGGGEAGAVRPDDMVLGEPDAPITIIEYASLTCSHCGVFHNETLPDLKEHYIEPGKARLVYRDFPLDQMALRAAMLAHCAGEERYFGFLEVLFDRQTQWAGAPDPMAALKKVAKLGGMGEEQVDQCLAREGLAQQVMQSRLVGEQTFDVQSTPTFIIDGKKVAGSRSFEEFDEILQSVQPGS